MLYRECILAGTSGWRKEERWDWLSLLFLSLFSTSHSPLVIPSLPVQYRGQGEGSITPIVHWEKIGDSLQVWHKISNSFLRHLPSPSPSEHISIYFFRKYPYWLLQFPVMLFLLR